MSSAVGARVPCDIAIGAVSKATARMKPRLRQEARAMSGSPVPTHRPPVRRLAQADGWALLSIGVSRADEQAVPMPRRGGLVVAGRAQPAVRGKGDRADISA